MMDLQALSRSYRLGQKKEVVCVRMVVRGGVEEKMEEIRHKKTLLSSSLLLPPSSSSSSSSSSISSSAPPIESFKEVIISSIHNHNIIISPFLRWFNVEKRPRWGGGGGGERE